MKKMKTLFLKDKNNIMTEVPDPNNQWVFNGRGVARVKLDGTACAIINGDLYKRYDCKLHKKTGKRKIPPKGWIPCQKEPDPITKHWPGWAPVTTQDKHHLTAFSYQKKWTDGTYELIGHKIQGNPYSLSIIMLVTHNTLIVSLPSPFTYISFKEFFTEYMEEGVVFYGPEGQRCKLRRIDFGLTWPIKE